MRRKGLAGLLAFACILLAGCGGLLNQEYRSVVPHLEQAAAAGEQADWYASNATELKNALLQAVYQHSAEVKIKFANYTGNIKNDLSQAAVEIPREDPVGAYTVDFMSPDYNLLAGEVTVSVYYRPDRAEGILQVSNLAGARDELEKALVKFQTKLVLDISYYESGADLAALLREAYFQTPARAVGLPSLSVALYPDSGLGFHRIAEMTLTYPDVPVAMRARVTAADAALRALYAQLPDELEPPYRALALYDLLCAAVSYDEEGARALQEGRAADAPDDLYRALAEGRALSAGYALAYKQLCDTAGLECRLVLGERLGNSKYVWNLVQLDGDWYHVDPAADAAGGNAHDWFLKTDEAMQTVANWNRTATPRCDSERYSYGLLTETDPTGVPLESVPAAAKPPADEETPTPPDDPDAGEDGAD
ncbi:MAG: hypothetical protein LBT60_04395 [Oscillospiraceae bacterium]|jgi:hypothetical protein|nr:hypothetical protein [Oscillospiraceae bacterium]